MKNILSTTIIITFLLFGCAGQRPPQGGPLDTTPPEIISVYPMPNTVNFTDNKVVFEFSEYVDRRSVEDAIFISPTISDLEYDWSGTEISIVFNEQLKKNTTYVVTLGTDIVDVNNRNKMAKSFSLSFSTGVKIDKGMIEGEVVDEKPDGVMIFSYRINDINPDTLNPAKTKPDYITQTGAKGDFLLRNLAFGTYRLFAIRDEYKNLLYDPETDAAGTLPDDVNLSEKDTLVSGLQFTISKEDTTPPRIVSVNASDNRHLIVQFSEKIDTSSVNEKSFSISDTLGASALSIQGIYPTNTANTTFGVLTSPQVKDSLYLLRVKGIKDTSGFVIHPLASQKLFSGSVISDTLPPAILYSSIKDSGSVVNLNEKIQFIFSDALKLPIANNSINFFKAKDSAVVDYTLQHPTIASLQVLPKKMLQPTEQYILQFRLKNFSDYFNNAHKDTVKIFKFSTIDPEKFGSIEGKIISKNILRNVVVQGKNIASSTKEIVTATTDKNASFSFPQLSEGKYVFKAFEDLNLNGVLDAGKVFPFQKSERFILLRDTLKVRARWPIDGVQFR